MHSSDHNLFDSESQKILLKFEKKRQAITIHVHQKINSFQTAQLSSYMYRCYL